MNWFRDLRSVHLIWSGTISTLGAVWFLFSARGDWNEASTRFTQTAAELNRLERLAPYPSEENLRRMKVLAGDYEAAVTRLNDELRMRVTPVSHLAPNEFQAHLRVAMSSVAEKARAQGVRLPDRFYLGFDEFASALPNELAAPLLGEELAQIEWIVNTLIEARVDSLISFRRLPLPEEHGTTAVAPKTSPTLQEPAATIPAVPKLLERNVVEATFVSTPAAARRVLNQIAGANRHFCIVRLLQVRNEQDKGPLREVAESGGGNVRAAAVPVPATALGTKLPAGATLNFIVGHEHVETSVRVEIVRFTL